MNTKEIDGHRKTLLSTTQDLQLKSCGVKQQQSFVYLLATGRLLSKTKECRTVV